MFEPTEHGEDLCIYSNVVLRRADTKEDEVHSSGTLNIVEYNYGKCIEWRPMEVSVVSESQDQDLEWSVVNTQTRRARTSSEGADSVGRPKMVRIMLSELKSIRLCHNRHQLIFTQKDGISYVAFFEMSNAESFANTLNGFVIFVKVKRDKNLFYVRDDISDLSKSVMPMKSFSDINLISENSSYSGWSYLKHFQDNPIYSTLEAFCKLTDFMLYRDTYSRPEEAVVDLLNSTRTSEASQSLQPASSSSGEEYEVIEDPGLEIILPPRPACHRESPLTPAQWTNFKDSHGRITDPDTVKRIIFKGGISPSLRYEVWKFLLNYYPWNSTNTERIDLKKKKTDEYFKMKLQWMSMTRGQEERFASYRDHKSLIEKDVSRTDRTNPYYKGDNNPHLSELYDILMTYVMYNFDLGYVQGMSDLLSPILCLMENEVDAFWCFVGFMDKVSNNFEMDQTGMKNQLYQLHLLLTVTEPQLAKYLDRHESGNMFFCFRWILILFKREFSPVDIMRLWEVLWTELPCKNFHLLLCVAILDTEKSVLMENNFEFTEILRHINDLSLHIELPWALSKAEGIYCQLMAVASELPDNIRSIIGLEPLKKFNESDKEHVQTNGQNSEISNEEESIRIGNDEVSYERGLSLSHI